MIDGEHEPETTIKSEKFRNCTRLEYNEFVYSRLIEIHSKQIKTIEMHIVYFNATVVAAAEPSII